MIEPPQKRLRVHPGLESATNEMERIQNNNLALTREVKNLTVDLTELKKINKIIRSELEVSQMQLTQLTKDHQVDLWEKDDVIEDLRSKLEVAEEAIRNSAELRTYNMVPEKEVEQLTRPSQESEGTVLSPTVRAAEFTVKGEALTKDMLGKRRTLLHDNLTLPVAMRRPIHERYVLFDQEKLTSCKRHLDNRLVLGKQKVLIDVFFENMLSPDREIEIMDLITEYEDTPKTYRTDVTSVKEGMPSSLKKVMHYKSYLMYPHLYAPPLKSKQFYTVRKWTHTVKFCNYYSKAKKQKEVLDYINKEKGRAPERESDRNYMLKGLGDKRFAGMIADKKILNSLISRCTSGILLLIREEDMTTFRKLDLHDLKVACDFVIGTTDLHLRRYCRLLEQCVLTPIRHRDPINLDLPHAAVASKRPIMDAMEAAMPKFVVRFSLAEENNSD